MIGTTLGHYRILKPLGSGGMGEVFAAEDLTLGRRVAIKILPDTMATDPDRRSRFEREARAVAALNHPNIVTIHSVETAAAPPFLTMELVEGSTLAQLLPASGLPIDGVLSVGLHLADALAAAHQKGITHRDLKPANIMIGADGRVKVLDFGLAKLHEAAVGESASAIATQADTGEGRIVGTVAYMSPEQAEGRAIDHRSDIFSLGVVLYEMVTGERPFKGDSSIATLSAILRDTPRPVASLRPDCPRELAQIIKRCLAKDVERRYESAKDIRNELEDLKHDLDSGESSLPAATAFPAPSTGQPEGHLSSRRSPPVARRRLVIVGSGLGLAAVVVTSFLWIQTRTVPPTLSWSAATLSQLTANPGVESWPSLSPDGKWLLFSALEGEDADVFLLTVGGQTALNLTADSAVGDDQPAWSPDGEQIAFRSERGGGGIFVMGRTGDSVRRLTDTGFSPAWSPDAKEIAFATTSTPSPYARAAVSQLWAVAVATGARRLLTNDDAVHPQWSPHGERVAYWGIRRSERAEYQRDIWTVAAHGGAPVALTDDSFVDWNPKWSPDGSYLYFLSNRGGSENIWRIAVDENTGQATAAPEPVTIAAQRVFAFDLSGDGLRLALLSVDARSNIKKLSFDPDAGRVTGGPVDITTGSRSWNWMAVSPDGKRVAFSSYGVLQEDLFVSETVNARPQQLTDDAWRERFTRWSPDSRRIAFYSERSGNAQLWAILPDGSGLTQLSALATPLLFPVWSPDGRQIAAASGTLGEATSIIDVGSKPAERATAMLPKLGDGIPFTAWSWSPDGRQIAGNLSGGTALGPGRGVAAYSLESKTFTSFTTDGADPWWLGDSRRLIYRTQGRLLMLDTVTRETRELWRADAGRLWFLSMPADDRSIYFGHSFDEGDIFLASLAGVSQPAPLGGREGR